MRVATVMLIGLAVAGTSEAAWSRPAPQPADPNTIRRAMADPGDPNFAYGHFCGVGNSQTGKAPIDPMDAACMVHDSCVGDRLIPNCSCHIRLEHAAAAIGTDQRQPILERLVAVRVERAVSSLPCLPGE
jgi:hypothetical protein